MNKRKDTIQNDVHDLGDSVRDVDFDELSNIELTDEQLIEIGLNPTNTEPFEKSYIIKQIDHMINVVTSILNEWYIEKDVSDSLREHFIDHYTNQKYTLLYLKTVYLIFNKDKEKRSQENE